MSRSYKKSIIKDCPRNYKKSVLYWRKIRRVQKQYVSDNEDVIIPHPKSIINDYDYIDYIIDYEYTIIGNKYKEQKEKSKRK